MSRRMIVIKVKDNIPCIFISPQASIKFINPRSCGVKTFCRLKNLIIYFIKISLKWIIIVYNIIIFLQKFWITKMSLFHPPLGVHRPCSTYRLFTSPFITRKGNVTFTSSSVQQHQPQYTVHVIYPQHLIINTFADLETKICWNKNAIFFCKKSLKPEMFMF